VQGNKEGGGLANIKQCASLQLLHLHDVHVGDADLNGIGQLPALETFSFDPVKNSPITDAGIEALGGLSRLKLLSLRNASYLNSKNGAALGKMASLKKLQIKDAGKQWDDKGVLHLATAQKLTKVVLDRCEGFGGAWLHKCLGLTSVKLFHCKNLTFKFYKHVAVLRHLQVLVIDSCKGLDPKRFKYMLRNVNLRTLQLTGELASDSTLKHVPKMINLQKVVFKEGKMTGEGIHKLSLVKGLQRIDLIKCNEVNKKDVKALQTALPNCKINVQS